MIDKTIKLGCEPRTKFKNLAKIMYEADLEYIRKLKI